MKKGQAMIEALIAVLFIAFVFITLFYLSRLLTAKVIVEHAAARAARAKCVGFSDFMCLKAARVAMIPVSGQRTMPLSGSGRDFAANLSFEEGRIPVYLCAKSGVAGGVLHYERWDDAKVKVDTNHGASPFVSSRVSMFMPTWNGTAGKAEVHGQFDIEAHYPLYME